MRSLKFLSAALLLAATLVSVAAESVLSGTFRMEKGEDTHTVVKGKNWNLLLEKGKLRLRGEGIDIDAYLARLDNGSEQAFRITAGKDRVTLEAGKHAYAAPGSLELAGFGAGIAAGVTVKEIPAPPPPSVKWELVWSDEFNEGDAPAPEKWGTEKGFIRNQELQYYTDQRENLRVENGMLVLEAKVVAPQDNPRYSPTAEKWPLNQQTYRHTSASVWSKAPFTLQTGSRLEIRAKFPTGAGLWPAIWATGVNRSTLGWPRCGEIDFFEYFGGQPEKFSCNLHFSGPEDKHASFSGKAGLGFDPGREFHLYAAEWDAAEVRFYVDGKLVMRRPLPGEADNPAESYRQPFNLRINFALRSNRAVGTLADDSLPKQFLIDYVRVYRQPEQP